jgi:hypothetical protein
LIQIPGRKGSEGAVAEIDGKTETTESKKRHSSGHTKAICDAIAGFIGRVLQGADKKSMERLVPLALKMAAAIFEAANDRLFIDPVFIKKIDEPVVKELVKQYGLQSGLNGDLINSLVIFIFANYRLYFHGQYVFFVNHLVSLLRSNKSMASPVPSPSAAVRLAGSPNREAILDFFLHVPPRFIANIHTHK